MQDRYAGDIGDFGKYGLLRALCGDDLRLGVLWYAFEGDLQEAPNDGKHIGYLDPRHGDRFSGCDPELFDGMRAIVTGKRRTIAAVERSGVLPPATVYFGETLTFARHERREERLVRRHDWLSRAQRSVERAHVLFADPDNGIEPRSVKAHHLRGPKYIFYDDIDRFLDRKRSLIVYHHLTRRNHREQIWEMLGELRKRFGGEASSFALRYRRGTARAYFVMPAPHHAGTLRMRAEMLLGSPWGQNEHFDPEIYE